jgi:hypothetical protein
MSGSRAEPRGGHLGVIVAAAVAVATAVAAVAIMLASCGLTSVPAPQGPIVTFTFVGVVNEWAPPLPMPAGECRTRTYVDHCPRVR